MGTPIPLAWQSYCWPKCVPKHIWQNKADRFFPPHPQHFAGFWGLLLLEGEIRGGTRNAFPAISPINIKPWIHAQQEGGLQETVPFLPHLSNFSNTILPKILLWAFLKGCGNVLLLGLVSQLHSLCFSRYVYIANQGGKQRCLNQREQQQQKQHSADPCLHFYRPAAVATCQDQNCCNWCHAT